LYRQLGCLVFFFLGLNPGFLTGGGLLSLAAQEELPSGRIIVRLSTRVVQEQTQVIWARETEKLTVYGQTVSVKLTGQNIIIFTRITPYYRDGETILVVAQGEVFYSFGGETNYYTTLKTLLVDLGETFLFFPLGQEEENSAGSQTAETDYFIEVEIQVLPGAGEP
jgi:hypothetical protein